MSPIEVTGGGVGGGMERALKRASIIRISEGKGAVKENVNNDVGTETMPRTTVSVGGGEGGVPGSDGGVWVVGGGGDAADVEGGRDADVGVEGGVWAAGGGDCHKHREGKYIHAHCWMTLWVLDLVGNLKHVHPPEQSHSSAHG